ncbi:winged helix-turn-helix transcriptional regulator [archaeon]|jgi:DNA-binding transcriptional ArsR family regulator|nr:winged helix-turn-helix transcriptional regulator [archaeon]
MINKTYLEFFKSLCNETRASIILALKDKPLSVSQIMEETKMEQSRISHNLPCLVKTGFITVEQIGKQRIYSLNKDTIVPILNAVEKHMKKYVTDIC